MGYSETKVGLGKVGRSEDWCVIEDRDFYGTFDGSHWTVEWFWKNDQPPQLRNTIGLYSRGLVGKKKIEFEKVVDQWIDEGILVPWEGPVEQGILPLMAVEQPTKDKVRPVLDYRELNRQVECHTGDDVTDVCSDTLREWRQMKGVTLVDLKSAYLQIRVAKKLWKYQLVEYKGRTYCLTRLGFGLNCAPRIMSKILKTVLQKDKQIHRATNSYIDDILLDEHLVTAKRLTEHLKRFGLLTKPPEQLDGGAALGLRLRQVGGELIFSRGNQLPSVTGALTRRELFSVCGKLTGHYPIANWLRVACSYIKRKSSGSTWEDDIGEEAMAMLRDVLDRVQKDDPVIGKWYVEPSQHGVIWCDASSIAMGVLLEINDKPVEDAAWLRKPDDCNHINVAELESVLKGINLALKWDLKNVELRTDSATVQGWVSTVINEDKRVKTKGAAEMLVKRRLGVLRDLLDEYDLRLTVSLVSTHKNKADALTRVKKEWLKTPNAERIIGNSCGAVCVKDLHDKHHMGVDKTLYLAKKVDPRVRREEVERVVKFCDRCQSIDPAPASHVGGEISISENWTRLAIDVTHYRQIPYLTMIDCGPSRYAIWRKIRGETAVEIADVLNEVFIERGPVSEVLMDNSATFHSSHLGEMFRRWNVKTWFRAAYRPSGNGIIERNHRTIKTIAERSNITPPEATFWYNITPRSGTSNIPQKALYSYEWRYPAVDQSIGESEEAVVNIGDEVWVKPPNVRCTTKWNRGTVTKVNSRNNVMVDGMPRHILDVRPVVEPPGDENVDSSEDLGGVMKCDP